MLKKEYRTMIKKIQFGSAKAEGDLQNMLDQASDFAVEKLLKSLRCNSHKVLGIRVGESRRDNRKEMIFLDVENLNGHKLMYRLDFIQNGKTVEAMKNVTKGWGGVSAW